MRRDDITCRLQTSMASQSTSISRGETDDRCLHHTTATTSNHISSHASNETNSHHRRLPALIDLTTPKLRHLSNHLVGSRTHLPPLSPSSVTFLSWMMYGTSWVLWHEDTKQAGVIGVWAVDIVSEPILYWSLPLPLCSLGFRA